MTLQVLKPVHQYSQLKGITMEIEKLYSYVHATVCIVTILLDIVLITMMVCVILTLFNTTRSPLNT